MKPLRVQVYCRVRNADLADNSQLRLSSDKLTIQVSRTTRGIVGDETAVQNYAFDGVLSGAAATQEAIYTSTTSAMIEGGILQGISGTVMCYGARGTGKSYTLFGGTDYRTRGIAPRVVQHLFKGIAEYLNERVYQIDITFVQLFGQQVVDLLAEPQEWGGSSKLSPSQQQRQQQQQQLRPSVTLDGKGEVQLKHIVRRRCQDETEALAALFEGLHAATASNTGAAGRASHLVATLYVQYRSAADTDSETRYARCNLVELASPQRVEDASGYEQRAEVQLMNRSLSTLEQVVTQLAQLHAGAGEGQTTTTAAAAAAGGATTALAGSSVAHVPYRQSKLTTLLKGSVGGRCLTTFIAHITLSKQAHEATTSTLNFARRMMRISVNPTTNVAVNAEAQMRALQQQVSDLKAELRLQGQLRHAQAKGGAETGAQQGGGGGHVGTARPSVVAAGTTTTASATTSSERTARAPPFAPSLGVDETQQLQQRVMAFVEGATATMQLGDVREMHACFALMRNMIEEKDQQVAALRHELQSKGLASAVTTSSGNGSSAAGAGGGHEHSASPSRGAHGVAERASVKEQQRQQHMQSIVSSQPFTGTAGDRVTEVYTPSILDTNRGVGYGTSMKPSAAGIIARMTTPSVPATSSATMTGGQAAADKRHGITASLVQSPAMSARRGSKPAADLYSYNHHGGGDRDGGGTGPQPASLPPIHTSIAQSGGDEQGFAQPRRAMTATDAQQALHQIPPESTAASESPSGLRPAPYRPATTGATSPAARNAPDDRPRTQPAPHLAVPVTALAQTTSMLWLRQQAVQEAAQMTAFEQYKQTTAGALQLRVLTEDQRNMAQKEAELTRLQRRLRWCGAVMQEKTAATPPSSASGLVAHRVSVGRTPAQRSPGDSALRPATALTVGTHDAAAPPARWPDPDVSYALSATQVNGPLEAADADEAEESRMQSEVQYLRGLPVAHVTAFHSRLQEQLRRHISENNHLSVQIRRRQAALLRNFEAWYAQQCGSAVRQAPGESPVPPHSARGAVQTAAMTGLPQLTPGGEAAVQFATTMSNAVHTVQSQRPIPHQTIPECGAATPPTWTDTASDHFLDAAERFDAMEMRRELTLDPESAAYFNAKRAIRARRREHKATVAADDVHF